MVLWYNTLNMSHKVQEKHYMKKEMIEQKLLNLFDTMNIKGTVIYKDNDCIRYVIPSDVIEEQEWLRLDLKDTCTKEYTNEFGMKVWDDEIKLVGFNFHNKERCTLNKLEQILKGQCNDIYRVSYYDGRVSFVSKKEFDLAQTLELIDTKKKSEIKEIKNYFGTIKIQL